MCNSVRPRFTTGVLMLTKLTSSKQFQLLVSMSAIPAIMGIVLDDCLHCGLLG